MNSRLSWTPVHYRIWAAWQERTTAPPCTPEVIAPGAFLWARWEAVYQQLRRFPGGYGGRCKGSGNSP